MSRHSKALLFVIVSTCLSGAMATEIDHEDCGTEGIIYSVEMTGCSNEGEPGDDEVCIVEKGAQVHGQVHFESGFEAEYLDCAIMGVINGLVSSASMTNTS